MFRTGLFCVVLFSAVAQSLGWKTWIRSTDVNDKRNWDPVGLPRSCDDISFAISNDITVFWSVKELIVTGLSLPASGTLTFPNDMSIELRDKALCPGARVMKYVRDEWKAWLDPFNWQSNSNETWLPHAMRIPCSGEDVDFPEGSNYAVQLPEIKVAVGKIYFGYEEMDGVDWSDFLNNEPGKSMFRSEEITQEPWLHDSECYGDRNCPCGKSSYVYQNRIYKSVPTASLYQAVCSYARPKCQPSGCFSPIIPEGHCCGVCGAIIKVRDGSQDYRVFNQIFYAVKDVEKYSENTLNYYVGKTSDDNIEIVVLAEKSEHMDDAMTSFATIKDYLSGNNFSVMSEKLSGPMLSAHFLSSPPGIAFGTFMAVMIFFAVLYFVYVVLPQKKLIKITDQSFGFARFRNVLQEAGSEEKLEIGTEPEELPGESSEGFHNPTFSNDSGPSTSRVQEEISESAGLETGQEYDNPTYHEMEKARELLGGTTAEGETENLQELSEIDL